MKEFEWKILAAYYPNPHRAAETYKIMERMMRKIKMIKQLPKTKDNLEAFTEDMAILYDIYHGSTQRTEETEKFGYLDDLGVS